MLHILFKTCTHDKVSPHLTAGYCPDCGEYIENNWYISRCECCGIKQKSFTRGGKIVTQDRFCRNCGSNSFVAEKLESLDIVNINYAVVMKQTGGFRKSNIIQTWIEKNTYTPMKLLVSY